MKLNKNFITHISGEDNMIVSSGATDFAGIVKGNQTAGVIFECLKEETSEEKIVDKVYEEFDAPKEQIEKDVKRVLDELRKIGAIDD